MESLEAEGLVHRDSLAFREVRRPTGDIAWVNLRGRIWCSDDVLIRVDKWLATTPGRRGGLLVKGRWYSYHAWIPGKPRRDLLRYDNSHGEGDLHRHFFDDSGDEIAIEPVSYDSLPRLDLLIREAVALARKMPIEELYAASGAPDL